MRVATYTQPTAVTRGSIAALSILVVTIVLGTTVGTTLLGQFAPALAGSVTLTWMALYVLAFLGLMFGQGVNWISWLVRYRILFVLLLVGSVLTVSWSFDARISAERAVHLLGACLLGIYFGFTIPLLTTLRVLAVVLGVIMVASVAAALAMPELGISAYEGQLVWSGVMNSKNHLGFWAATGVLLYVALSDSTRSLLLRLLCYLMAGLCLMLLAFSHSATSLLAMIVGGTLSSYLFIANRFQLGFTRMVVLAVLLVGVVGFAVANIDTAELVGRSDDLTGRGEVWAQTWKLVMDRPLGGYGYGVLWFPTDETLWIQQTLTDFTWVVHHAHNGFLQVASEVGLPLALFALLMVAQQMVEIIYCQYQRQQVGTLFVLAFVVTFLIGNFSEARFLVTRELYWILFIALPISMLRQVNLVSREEAVDAEDEDEDARPRAAEEGAGPFGVPTRVRPTVAPGRPALGHASLGAAAAAACVGYDASGSMASGADIDIGDDTRDDTAAGNATGSGVADQTMRWEEADGWDRLEPDDTGGLLDLSGDTDIDLGGDLDGDLGDDLGGDANAADHDGDATQILTPDDWISGDGGFGGENDLPGDRFDMEFDATGDGTDDWVDLPLDGVRR